VWSKWTADVNGQALAEEAGWAPLKKWVSGQARERSFSARHRQKAEIQPETSGNTHLTSQRTAGHLSRAAEFLAFCHFFIKESSRLPPPVPGRECTRLIH